MIDAVNRLCVAFRGLFVEEALDAHLWGLLERFEHHFYLADLAVAWEKTVGVDADIFRDVRDSLVIESVAADGVLVKVYQGD